MTSDEWPLAVELARMPGVCARLLALHIADADGRCQGCSSQVRPAPCAPCTLYRVAARARRIAGEHPLS